MKNRSQFKSFNTKASVGCIVLLAILFGFTNTTSAQQTPQFTQYMYNTMSINPAYAGSLQTLDIVGTYRDQWRGIDGAPVTQNLGIHSPLRNEKVGVGLNLTNDKLGPAKQFFADANFSYTVQVNPTAKLAFGLKTGVRIFNVDFTEGDFVNPNDQLNNNIDNRASVNLGGGLYLHSNNWYLGMSIPDFLSDDFYDDNDEAVAEEEIQYFLIGGYVFDFSQDLKFKPAFLAKYLDGTPLVVDVSANFLLYDRLTLGASYRFEDSFSGVVGFEVLKGFFAGYSYDASTTELSNYNDGTHELILRYTAPPKIEIIESPRFF